MHGPKGSERYTKSLINILSENLKVQPGVVNFQPRGRSGTSRPNLHPSRRTGSPKNFQPGGRSSQPGQNPSGNSTTTSTTTAKESNRSFYLYAVKTFNKFSTLLN